MTVKDDLDEFLDGHQSPPDAVPLAWDAVDLEPVLDGERVTPAPSVLARTDGVKLFYPGRVNLVMGETESAKTWLVLLAAVQEMAQGNHVIFLDYEDVAETAVERLQTLGADRESILALFSYYESPPLLDEFGKELVRSRCSVRGQPTLGIVDGVTEAMGSLGLDPEKGVQVAQFYGGLPRWFANTGAAVVLLDHVVKNETARGRWATGSQHKISGLDGAAYGMEVVKSFGRERTGLAKVVISKDRCGHVRQHEGSGRTIAMFELMSWPDDKASARLKVPMPAGDPDAPFRPTIIMERISEALESATGPLNTRGVRAAVKGKNETLSLALDILVEEGYVLPEDGPRHATVYSSLRAFRDVQES